MAIQYDDSSIQILEGLEPVRKRPGMYIGSTDSHGLHHMIWEIVDNAVDEAINGFGKKITIILENDGSVSVSDQGRGMPIGKHLFLLLRYDFLDYLLKYIFVLTFLVTVTVALAIHQLVK